MKITRKQFIRSIGIGSAAALTPGLSLGASAHASAAPASQPLNIGLASYTLRSLPLDGVIATCKRLDIGFLALKSMHLPLEASPDEIKAASEKVRAAGIKLYGAGVIYMKTKEEVENAFAYANHAGLETIIGVPNHELLGLAEEQVKKYNIRLAIHNHGPGDNLYHSPNDVWAKIKNLDTRIGLCIDVGHVVRIKEDPIPMIKTYQTRLYDLHIKDVNKGEEDGTPLEFGRGVIDIPGIVKALKKIDYRYRVAIEYEKDGDDPVPGLAESIGYLRGVMRTV